MAGAPEIWKPIAGFENLYEVSNLGRVRSLGREISQGNRWGGRITYWRAGVDLQLSVATNGYYQVTLCKRGEPHQKMVHSLVAEAFLGPRPEGMLVLHDDGVRTNPALSNLYYGTYQDNADDAGRHGTRVLGERHLSAKLTEDDVREIRRLEGKLTQREFGDRYGVTEGAIAHILKGRNWKSVAIEAAP